ncbi:MAG: hypothetical protein R3E79_42940 [Caldilineaceae bacterium]
MTFPAPTGDRPGGSGVGGVARELVAAQLVVEESADHFAFRHALTRQAVYGGLGRERQRLHRAIGLALEQRVGAEVPAAHDLRPARRAGAVQPRPGGRPASDATPGAHRALSAARVDL